MVVDTSAIIALVRGEPEEDRLWRRIEAADMVLIGAPSLLEAGLVLSGRLGRDPQPILDLFVARSGAEIVPFHQDHAEAALDAWMKYGKGRHPAALNYGDCMAYATANLAGMPLLYVGEGFAQTDIAAA